jgi:hypothetical protein
MIKRSVSSIPAPFLDSQFNFPVNKDSQEDMEGREHVNNPCPEALVSPWRGVHGHTVFLSDLK